MSSAFDISAFNQQANKTSVALYTLSVFMCLLLGCYIFYISYKQGQCFSKWWPRSIAIYIIIVTIATLLSAFVVYKNIKK